MQLSRFSRILAIAITSAIAGIASLVVGIYIFGSQRETAPGTFHIGSPGYSLVDDCFEAIGSSRKRAGHPEFALCQCYVTEAMERQVAAEDMPLLLEALHGAPLGTSSADADHRTPRPAVSSYPRDLQGFLETALPRCVAKFEKIAAAERRFADID